MCMHVRGLAQAVDQFVSHLPLGSTVCVVSFARDARVDQPPVCVSDERTRAQVRDKLRCLSFVRSGTNVEAALKAAAAQVALMPPSLLLFLSDGQANEGELNDATLASLALPLSQTCIVHAVAFASSLDSSFNVPARAACRSHGRV